MLTHIGFEAKQRARKRQGAGAPQRNGALLFVLLATLGGAGNAIAQAPPPIPLPKTSVLDENGVDLASGKFQAMSPSIAIGDPAAGGLSFQQWYDGVAKVWRHNFQSGFVFDAIPPTSIDVDLLGETRTYVGSIVAGFYDAFGDSMMCGVNCVVTTAEGSVAVLADGGRILSFTKPSGEAWNFTYRTNPSSGAFILSSVTNNLGYQIKFQYASATADDFYAVVAINNAVDYCDPNALACGGFTRAWPQLTIARGHTSTIDETAFTDNLARTTLFHAETAGSTYTFWVRRPSSATPNYTYSSSGGPTGRIGSFTDGASTWSYSYGETASTLTTTRTDPLGHTRIVAVSKSNNAVTSDQNGLGQTTSYGRDFYGRVTSVTFPEGNQQTYVYDGRGNITQRTSIPKAGSGLGNIVITAAYDAACSNPKTCNQPNAVTDARGAVTNFTYDSGHGGVLTITSPQPTPSDDHPQTRFAYSSLYAWYKNSGGSIVQAPTPTIKLTQTSACATTASCINTADETRKTIAYGAAGVANNLLPTAATTASGDGALSATIATAYDDFGNAINVDGPLPGAGDTTGFHYDAARQLLSVVGPDPDGAGPLKNRATLTGYNLDGQVTSAAQGTSNPDGSGFVASSTVATTYNAQGRQIEQRLNAAGAAQAITQFSYDAAGRLTCTALRMNLGVTPPASACSFGTQGADGPDRIRRQIYNAGDQLIQETALFTPSSEQSLAVYTYTPNGVVQTLADANGNLTTLEYDGFDRLSKMRYPDASNGHVSSSTDYETYGYDANSNRTSQRLRDGSSLGFTYDTLNRQTLLSAPAGTASVTSAYDYFGRLTGQSIPGQALSFGYDALSRNVIASGPLGAVSYVYDVAGRRTRMTWPDGFYVIYEYDLYDDLLTVKENGSATLASFAYDDLGRRVSVTRGNGVSTAYAYDPALRLSTLSHDLAGTAQDYSATFAYNPASQQTSRTASSAYAFGGAGVNQTYAPDGLNRYASVSGTSYTYDALGDLTSDGVRAFGYDKLSRLITGPSSSTFSYDAASRLYQTGGSRFLYDGADVIAEYDAAGAVARRYVHGAGEDEPLVSYDAAGVKSWLLPDAQGSIIAVTNASAAATAINTYDEYGRPGASNAGWFQFTGQGWLAQAGLYTYKARVYDPTIGRFLQTDPIGYSGGLNLFAYVGNDPINLTDPSGMDWCLFSARSTREGGVQGGPSRCVDNLALEYLRDLIGQIRVGSPQTGDGIGGDSAPPGPTPPPNSPNSRAQKQQACPAQSPMLNVLGKINAAGTTKLGLTWGLLGYAAGKVFGSNPGIQLGNNAIQFTNSPLQFEGRPITIGNVQVYGRGVGPNAVTGGYSPGAPMKYGKHEEGHTLQAEILGPLYLPTAAAGSVLGANNPLEVGADRYARGQSCSGF